MKTLQRYRFVIFSLCSLSLLTAFMDSTAFADYQAAYVAYRNGNFTETLRQLEPLDQQGNPHAQYLLGEMYRDGQGFSRNHKTAASWYRRAAKQGNESAQLALAQMYERGEGVQQNYAKSAYWYRWAAEQEVAEAQFRLGQYYISGLGVEKDERKAEMWYRLAARQGHEQAVENFGQPSTNDEVAQLEEFYQRWKQASSARLATLLERGKEAEDLELQGEVSPPMHSNWPVGLLGFLAVIFVLWLVMRDSVFGPSPLRQLTKRLRTEPEQRPSDPPSPSSWEASALDVEEYRRQRLHEDLKDIQRSNEPEDQELDKIDQRIRYLSSLAERNEKKGGRAAICQIFGAFLLLGTVPLLLPLGTEVHWTPYHFFIWFGLPLFLYGWIWTRKHVDGLREETQLYELARLLKQAELDKRLTLTTELDGSALIFHVHDKKNGLEQRCWVKRLEVTYHWRQLHFSCNTEPGYRWRSKHKADNAY